MRLTSEQFEQMIHSLRGNRNGHERRATTRVGLRAMMDLRIKNGNRLGPFQTVRVRDISAGGVGMMTNTLMRPETEVVVYLSNESGPMMLLQYTIMNARKMGEQYIVGLRLDRKLASEEEVFTPLPTPASILAATTAAAAATSAEPAPATAVGATEAAEAPEPAKAATPATLAAAPAKTAAAVSKTPVAATRPAAAAKTPVAA